MSPLSARLTWACLMVTSMLPTPTPAQASEPVRPLSSSELRHAIGHLKTAGSVLYVAAHPDDENTNLLAYLVNVLGVRTAYLSMTRGDGGQNLIGAEQGDALGLIRTQELLAARRVDGAEQFFTRARDFGYSKSPVETLRLWGHDEVLLDVVRVVRRFRPDVIITRFPTQHSAGQHGHHTASAILAVEAAERAADPRYQPAALRGLPTWKTKGVIWNRSGWSLKPGEDLTVFRKVDVGVFVPELGRSVGEISAESRSMHKSQGFGVAKTRGPIVEFFRALVGQDDDPLRVLRHASDTAPGMAQLRAGVDDVSARFSSDDPSASTASLGALIPIVDAIPDVTLRDVKGRQLRELIASCAGLWVDYTAEEARVARGSPVAATMNAIVRGSATLRLAEVRQFNGATLDVGVAMTAGVAWSKTVSRSTGMKADELGPYWTAHPGDPGRNRVDDATLVGLPERPTALRATFVFDLPGGQRIELDRPLVQVSVDPLDGEKRTLVEVVPEVGVYVEPRLLVFSGGEARRVSVRVASHGAAVQGRIAFDQPAGWRVAGSPEIALAKHETTELRFDVTPPPSTGSTTGELRAQVIVGERRYAKGAVSIEHRHIPHRTLLVDAACRLVRLDLKRAGDRIGYVPGAADEVPDALRRVGYDVTMLDDAALERSDLDRFDAILTGVRAFNTNTSLRRHKSRLFSWVERGGVLVVQYVTNNRLAKLEDEIAPLPLRIGRARVTDERAKITFLSPDHPLLNTPNRIAPSDFEGWVQERGLYFGDTWDPAFTPVLQMSDPGERPLQGALVVARHGKGRFVYSGLAFFRQLPAGVPGAYRLMANLLAR